MILPDRVFGRAWVNRSGRFRDRADLLADVLAQFGDQGSSSSTPATVTKAAMPVPSISWGMPTTAASTTLSCATRRSPPPSFPVGARRRLRRRAAHDPCRVHPGARRPRRCTSHP